LWPALLAAIAATLLVLSAVAWFEDPLRPSSEPLPALPAVTLAGDRLDTAWFAGRSWVILVWLPG